MKIIEKDILTVERGIIFQQVNCQRVMGSGLAKSIKDKWPTVYERYMSFYKDDSDITRLGEAQFIQVNDNPKLEVCNLFSQLYYGYEGVRYTDYGALKFAFNIVTNKVWRENLYFPYNMGAGLGGGDWKVISKMIERWFPDATICKLPG